MTSKEAATGRQKHKQQQGLVGISSPQSPIEGEFGGKFQQQIVLLESGETNFSQNK